MSAISKYYKIVLWSIIIGILCFIPGNEFKEVKINIPHLDKIIHFIMFYTYGLLVQSALKDDNKWRNRFLIIGLFYGGIIELIQHYCIPMRSGDIIDYFVDIVGLICGALSYKYYPKFIKQIL